MATLKVFILLRFGAAHLRGGGRRGARRQLLQQASAGALRADTALLLPCHVCRAGAQSVKAKSPQDLVVKTNEALKKYDQKSTKVGRAPQRPRPVSCPGAAPGLACCAPLCPAPCRRSARGPFEPARGWLRALACGRERRSMLTGPVPNSQLPRAPHAAVDGVPAGASGLRRASTKQPNFSMP